MSARDELPLLLGWQGWGWKTGNGSRADATPAASPDWFCSGKIGESIETCAVSRSD